MLKRKKYWTKSERGTHSELSEYVLFHIKFLGAPSSLSNSWMCVFGLSPKISPNYRRIWSWWWLSFFHVGHRAHVEIHWLLQEIQELFRHRFNMVDERVLEIGSEGGLVDPGSLVQFVENCIENTLYCIWIRDRRRHGCQVLSIARLKNKFSTWIKFSNPGVVLGLSMDAVWELCLSY